MQSLVRAAMAAAVATGSGPAWAGSGGHFAPESWMAVLAVVVVAIAFYIWRKKRP
jgi:hypothetical protein